MSLTRVFLTVLILTLIIGCGKKEEPVSQQPVSQPQLIEKDADALFDEFFDDSSNPQAFESTPVETVPAQREITFSPNGKYVVQVSTIASSTLADEIAKKLTSKGFPAYVVMVENPTTELVGTYYRVRIGGFDNSADAKYFGENMLRPLGYNFWVDNRANDNVGVSVQTSDTYYPQAVDYDAVPATPAPQPVVEESWGTQETPALTETQEVIPTEPTSAPAETVAPVVPAENQDIQPVPTPQEAADSDTGWGEFEW